MILSPPAGAPHPTDMTTPERKPPEIRVRGAASVADAQLFAPLDLTFPAGRWTSVLGRSGVGKSSLLRAVAGLLAPDVFTGDVAASDGAPLVGRVAFMAQDPLTPPWLTAREAAALGPRLRGDPVEWDRVDAALDACDIAELGARRPDELSGGQRHRVALARLLVEDRPVALLDEPLSALDALTRAELIETLHARLDGVTVIHVTHDPSEAAQLAHRAVALTARGAATRDLPGAPLRAWDVDVTRDAARTLRAALGAP